MVDITEIDHVTAGLKLLPGLWDNSPILRGILGAWLTPLNSTEQCSLDVRDGFNILTAVGAQLDIIGAYFDEERGGRTDTEYRNAILAVIAATNGSGTPDQLIDLFSTYSNSNDVKYFEHYPLSVALVANLGNSADINVTPNMQKAAPACIEFGALMYDPDGFAWIGNETAKEDAFLITNLDDQLITDIPDDIVVIADFEQVDDNLGRSNFIDSAIDGTSIGYGQNYGEAYGGRVVDQSQFVDSVIKDNAQTPTSSSGLGFDIIKWALEDEFDPITGTTNKFPPIIQFQDSGLKPKEPMPRQFFNWMMATIDAWFGYYRDRAPVDAIRMTIQASKTAADFGAQYPNADQTSTTWVETSSSPTSFAGVDTFVFKRTA